MNLVVVEGKTVHRYEGSKHLASFQFDMSGMSEETRKAHVEYMRKHGFAQYEIEDLQQELELITTGEGGEAFVRISRALQEGTIAMTPRYAE